MFCGFSAHFAPPPFSEARVGWQVCTMEAGDEVWSVAFSPDGSHIASGSNDDLVKIWNWTEVSSSVRV